MTLPGASRLRAVLLLLAVLGAALAVPASAEDRLLERGGRGPVWTAATLTTDGRAVTSRLALGEVALPFHLGARLYDADHKLRASTNVTLRSSEDGVLVSAEPVPGVELEFDGLDRGGDARVREVVGSFTINPQAPTYTGTYSLVLWAGSRDIGPWKWDVSGTGAALLGATSGSQTYLATSRDFNTGTVNLQAGGRGGGANVQGRAQVGASATLRPRRIFIGSYYPVLSSVDFLSVRTPTGLRQCLPDCQFDALSGTAAARAGEYVFQLSGAGAGSGSVQNAGDVVVAAAEVVLPVLR